LDLVGFGLTGFDWVGLGLSWTGSDRSDWSDWLKTKTSGTGFVSVFMIFDLTELFLFTNSFSHARNGSGGGGTITVPPRLKVFAGWIRWATDQEGDSDSPYEKAARG